MVWVAITLALLVGVPAWAIWTGGDTLRHKALLSSAAIIGGIGWVILVGWLATR
jgi:hypothetical protein